MKVHPTKEQYEGFERMFAYYNKKLFKGKLHGPLLVFNTRTKKCAGTFGGKRWKSAEKRAVAHEIALNPKWMTDAQPDEICATLVHEMAHLWQMDFGAVSRAGYHNKEWAAKMKDIGLHPSDTGKEDGKEVGQKMDHYIIEGGAFGLAYGDMPANCALTWNYTDPEPGTAGNSASTKKKSKAKYRCPSCSALAWGKPGLNIYCGIHKQQMAEQLPPGQEGQGDEQSA